MPLAPLWRSGFQQWYPPTDTSRQEEKIRSKPGPPAENSGHLHIYEVEDYSTLDQVGQNSQSSTENASVSTCGATIVADEFVISVFGNKSDMLTWTLGGEETTNEIDTVALGSEVVSTNGVQTATATTSAFDDLVII